MTFAIVGNNDGPLTLLRALRGSALQPVAVGLQKEADSALLQEYHQYISPNHLKVGFDQATLVDWLADYPVSWLINCFCNFKFTTLLDRYQVLNIHLAPLPRYRGRHPLPWALINGESTFGITIHQMTSEIDGGDIFWQSTVPVAAGMSVNELRNLLMEQLEAGFELFLADLANDKITPTLNDDTQATYVARRYPQDSALTEWHDRDTIIRKVWALRSTNDPAFIKTGNEIIKIHHAEPGSRRYVGLAAPFVSQSSEGKAEVVCLDGQTVWISSFEPVNYSFKLNQRI